MTGPRSLRGLLVLLGSLGAVSAVPAATATSSAASSATASSAAASSTSAASSSSSSSLPTTAAYFVSDSTTTIAHTTLVATGTDEGVIIVKETGLAYLNDVTIIKTGNTTDDSDSSFTDLNAAVGVETNGTIYLHRSRIITNGLSANGLHTYEDDSIAYIFDTVVEASGDGSHGIYVAGGAIYGQNLYISTTDSKGSAIATDQGGGSIIIGKVEAYTYGEMSALVYSTGTIIVDELTGTAAQAPAAVIDGSNSFTIYNPSIQAGPLDHGVFQFSSTSSTSGDDDTAYGYITGGSVSEIRGDVGLIFAANIIVDVYLTDVTTDIKSGILANASADSSWGDTGENGGTANIYLTDLDITGDIYVDDISEVNLYLYGTNWVGTFNVNNSTGNTTIYLDSRSTWTLSGYSSVDTITDEIETLANVRTGDYTFYYGTLETV